MSSRKKEHDQGIKIRNSVIELHNSKIIITYGTEGLTYLSIELHWLGCILFPFPMGDMPTMCQSKYLNPPKLKSMPLTTYATWN